jgi:hypothetical protein
MSKRKRIWRTKKIAYLAQSGCVSTILYLQSIQGKFARNYLLLSIPPKIGVSSLMGYLKGKSALMMFVRHANLNINLEIDVSG